METSILVLLGQVVATQLGKSGPRHRALGRFDSEGAVQCGRNVPVSIEIRWVFAHT